MQGDAPFSINIDKPPLGKYLIGVFIAIFKNPAYYGLFFGLGSLVVFYFIAKKLLQQSVLVYFATALLLLDPLFFSQFWKPWLDISQLFFLLLNIYLFLQIKDRKNFLLVFICGLSLGFFIEIKPPLVFPVIFILESAYIVLHRLWKQYIWMILGIFVGIILPYFAYSPQGFMTILKLHKYMYSIYFQSQLKVNLGAIWQVLGSGNFPDIVNGMPTHVSEWSIMWPISVFFGLLCGVWLFFDKKVEIFWKGIYLFVFLSLIIFTFIPFYTRYLIVLLPFMYLLTVKTIDKFFNSAFKNLFFIFIGTFSLVQATFFLYPRPDNVLSDFYYNFSHQYFQDIYQQDIAQSNRPLQDRQTYRIINHKLLQDATVKGIHIQERERNIALVSNTGTVKIRVTYKTQDLGSFVEDKIIHLVKEDNQWKIKWDWSIPLNGFVPGSYARAVIDYGKRGTIFDHTGQALAQDMQGYLVLVNPEKIDLKKEQEMVKFMERFQYKRSDYYQNEYLENSLPDSFVPLFTSHILLTDKTISKLLSYPGVAMVKYPTRIYAGIDPLSIENVSYTECCTRIYSSYNYHGIKGYEKEFDSVLFGYSGGQILLKDSKGDIVRTILEKRPKNGKDITIN